MKRAKIIEFISWLFIILFLYTGITKFLDYDVAIQQIALSPLFAPVAKAIVFVVPTMEIVTGILLFIPNTRKMGFYCSLLLMLLFTGYVLYILNFNDELPCTCGGILQQMSWTQHLLFNTTFIILAVVAIALDRGFRNEMNNKEKSLSTTG